MEDHEVIKKIKDFCQTEFGDTHPTIEIFPKVRRYYKNGARVDRHYDTTYVVKLSVLGPYRPAPKIETHLGEIQIPKE